MCHGGAGCESRQIEYQQMPRLKCLGIQTHCAMISANVVVNDDVKIAIGQHIVRSQANRTHTVVDAIMAGRRLIPIMKYANTRRCVWSGGIKKLGSCALDHGANQATQEREVAEGTKRRPPEAETPWFSCGTCGNKVKATRKAFSCQTLGKSTWCGKCRKATWLRHGFALVVLLGTFAHCTQSKLRNETPNNLRRRSPSLL